MKCGKHEMIPTLDQFFKKIQKKLYTEKKFQMKTVKE